MKKERKLTLFLTILTSCSLLLLGSCDRNYSFQKMEHIEGDVWNAKDTVTIEFEVQDTSKFHNFYLKLRNNTDYPYRNIYFFLDLEFPNGKHWLDTANCELADRKGSWTGSGIGETKDHEFLFIRRKKFPITGTHRFHIVHAMRKEKLRGIEGVGLALERVPDKIAR